MVTWRFPYDDKNRELSITVTETSPFVHFLDAHAQIGHRVCKNSHGNENYRRIGGFKGETK